MARTCSHGFAYIPSRGAKPRCLVCQPPTSEPYKVGLLQPDGTVKGRWDFVKEQADRAREAKMNLIQQMMRAAGFGDMEVITPKVDKDGWPKGSWAPRKPMEWKKG